jgi:hypothetical protein
MAIFDIISALATFLIGVIVGTIVVALAEFLGVAGWIAGLFFALCFLGVIYVSNKTLGLEMRVLDWLIGKITGANPRDMEAERITEDREERADYLGFLAGSILGILASLIWSPSLVFDLLPL